MAAGLVAIAASVAAADAVNPKAGGRRDRGRAEIIRTGGNEIYTVFVGDDAIDCGVWTAQTAGSHPAPFENVLFGNGSPGTSYTTLRSYTSGVDYTTAPSSFACTLLCDVAAPVVEEIVNPGPPPTEVGFRLTWTFVDVAPAAPVVELAQEVVVEGPVDGTETVDNTVIRETHIVRNLGPGGLELGLRKMWDWQIGGDDGPWFGDCETPTEGCDRSLELTDDGSLDGPYPTAYAINDDPATAGCPGTVVPLDPGGCDGTPLYTVAGTVAPPSPLVPAPTAPELLQFNSWPELFFECWQPPTIDAALCGGIGTPVDDTAAAYFYGRTAATAFVLAPGEERSFTQYVAAATGDCGVLAEPVVCDAGGPYTVACGGDVMLDGSDSSGSGLTYSWSSDCPDASVRSPTDPQPTLSGATGTPPCPAACTVFLTVEDDAGTSESCEAAVTVTDTAPPEVTPPAPLTLECSSTGGVPGGAMEVQDWLEMASASDCSGVASLEDDAPAFLPSGCPPGAATTVTFTATDGCDLVGDGSSTIAVEDTTPPAVVALLEPVQPLPPRSAAAPASVCSPPVSRAFAVRCGIDDVCDADPQLSAVLEVTTFDVPEPGVCALRVEQIPVACDEVVELRLGAPACPTSARSPRPAVSVTSAGVRVVSGESVVLVVTGRDNCGNEATATDDPAAEPSPLCDETLPDGTCCPAIEPPPPPGCREPVCPGVAPGRVLAAGGERSR